MPEIPGVTALHGDGEPGLDLVGLHTQPPSLLSTEAYRIAKLEKPWQNMAYRLHAPWDWSFSLWWVLISALWPSVPPSFPVCFCGAPICLLGDQIAAFKKNKKALPLTAHLNSRSSYVIPPWQEQPPRQLPTWPKRQIPAKVYITNGNATAVTAARWKFSL